MILQLLGKTTTLAQGWNRLSEKYGAWVWGDDVLLVNCGGILRFNSLKLDGIEFAHGPECIPPRAGLVFRGLKIPERTPATFKIGRKEIPYAPSLKSHVPHVEIRGLSILWHVAGTMQADTPGADGIEPLCGYSRDPRQILNLADSVMARTAVYWLDMATGEPIHSIPQKYTDVRGWGKETQIADVCAPNANPYDDSRQPLQANAPNGCTYEAALTGLDRYNSWIAPDGQHIIRTLGPVLAAVACGDPVAAFYAKVLAADAKYAHVTIPPYSPHMGSTYFGTRAVAWQALAMGLPRFTIDAIVAVQMPNGFFQRAPFGTTFSPDPWQDLGCPKNICVAATMEHFITVYVLAQAGQTVAVQRAMAGVFDHIGDRGYVPKFAGVSATLSMPFGVSEWWGPPDYFPWLALGAYAALAPNDRVNWERWCLSISTPSQGRATSLKDLRDRLRKEELGRGLCVPMLSVLEAMNL